MTSRQRRTRAAGLQVLVAVPDVRLAERISKTLLQQQLCACAQTLGPMTSRYTWKGRIETGREWLLVIKSRRGLYGAIEREVRRMHPYEVPEIIATPMSQAFGAYLDWIAASTPSTRRARRRPASRP